MHATETNTAEIRFTASVQAIYSNLLLY